MPPSLIVFGVINQNTPQENAGAFIGEGNFGGWDANMKINQRHGGFFGSPRRFNINIDNLELVDGAISDQDVKLAIGMDV